MGIPGYKLIFLVLSVIMVLFTLGSLQQLSHSYAERTLSSSLTAASVFLGAKTPLDISNKTMSESEEGQNNSLHYSVLSGTSNNWTLYDIRRRENNKRPELIGLRWII